MARAHKLYWHVGKIVVSAVELNEAEYKETFFLNEFYSQTGQAHDLGIG